MIKTEELTRGDLKNKIQRLMEEGYGECNGTMGPYNWSNHHREFLLLLSEIIDRLPEDEYPEDE